MLFKPYIQWTDKPGFSNKHIAGTSFHWDYRGSRHYISLGINQAPMFVNNTLNSPTFNPRKIMFGCWAFGILGYNFFLGKQ